MVQKYKRIMQWSQELAREDALRQIHFHELDFELDLLLFQLHYI